MAGTELEKHTGSVPIGPPAGRDPHADPHSVLDTQDDARAVEAFQATSYNPDAPSEEWGWHGHWSEFAGRGRTILLGLGVAGLLLMLFGNHVSHVENYFLVVCAIILAAFTLRSARAVKQRRRLR